MDSFFNGIGKWFGGVIEWCIHQPWIMEMVGAALVVMFVIAIFSDDQ